MTIPIGKHMHAEILLCDPHDVYTIHANNGSPLGYAEWYPRWRGYVFSPASGAVFSHDCCTELERFLERCNKAKRINECPCCGGDGEISDDEKITPTTITPPTRPCPECTGK
jgi:hypothetical protein